MATKAARRLLVLGSALVAAAGCGQILGVSDYEVDPRLDAAGAAPTDGGGAGGKSNGGTTNAAGTPDFGGSPGFGGDSLGGKGGDPSLPVAGEGPIGLGGAGGEAGATGGAAGAAGGPPIGEVVPCDSADCCEQMGGTAVGVELLKDGGFELGPPDAGSPWKEVTTTNGNELIIDDLSFGFKPKAGDWFVYLSGIHSEESTVYQTPVIPRDAGWLVVSGWRLFQIDSQDDVNADASWIGLYAYPNGERVEAPFYWSAPPAQDGWGDTPTWKYFEYSFDALPHQGLKREIDFGGSSDDYSTDADLTASSYLFDELSLKSFTCLK